MVASVAGISLGGGGGVGLAASVACACTVKATLVAITSSEFAGAPQAVARIITPVKRVHNRDLLFIILFPFSVKM
jgi:hypothetical protein